MPSQHLSSCALYRLPAKWPKSCNCGVAKADIARARNCHRVGYSHVARLKNWFLLWSLRLAYLCENFGSLRRFLPLFGTQKELSPRSGQSRECEAPQTEL